MLEYSKNDQQWNVHKAKVIRNDSDVNKWFNLINFSLVQFNFYSVQIGSVQF